MATGNERSRPLPGIHGRRSHTPTLLGVQRDRLATRITPWLAWKPKVGAGFSSLRTSTGCTKLLGARVAIELHGRLDLVRCTACLATTRRADFQNDLARLNAEWTDLGASSLPDDGDADLDHLDSSGFAMPTCGSCAGIQKPDVEKVHAIRDIYDGNRSGTADRSDAPHYSCISF